MTSVVDVAATIAELASLPAGAFAGTSLLHRAPERALRLGNLLFGEEWTGVRTPQFKYMRAEHGEERLFDLARDPGETLNQVAARSDLLAEGRALLADTR
jgi:hypothetical protein